MKKPAKSKTKSSTCAGFIIASYLVIHVIILSLLAIAIWVSPGWEYFLPLLKGLPENKFIPFQRAVISACLSGLGAAVFMIRSFYLNFAYGRENDSQSFHFLRAREIPRYILLPFSAVVMGPVGLGLLETGSLLFSGYSPGKSPTPILIVVVVCFLLGFSYHDTLNFFREYSRILLSSKKDKIVNKPNKANAADAKSRAAD
jgi:hypothetical protein